MAKSVLIVAGEISGDMHAARVVRALKRSTGELTFWGTGGDEMRAEGVELVEDVRHMAVMGLVEVLKHYRFFRRLFKQLLAEVDRRKPEVALLVDYPGFNLRLAKALKRRGVRVCYYICPKVWAWNKGRIPKMAQLIDRLFTIFPFEVELFKDVDLKVEFVGNPLVSQLDEFQQRDEVDLGWKGARKVALLPGSRQQEIVRILPVMLEAGYRMEREDPALSFLIASPNERVMGFVQEVLEKSAMKPGQLSVQVGGAREVMRQADAGLIASGTATLEASLLGLPHLIVYKTSPFTYWFARSVLTIRHIGLANIIAGRTICAEWIQQAARGDVLANELTKLLHPTDERAQMLVDFEQLHALLGGQDAAVGVSVGLLEELGFQARMG
jgi:lipid-A-disaccharide synthase